MFFRELTGIRFNACNLFAGANYTGQPNIDVHMMKHPAQDDKSRTGASG